MEVSHFIFLFFSAIVLGSGLALAVTRKLITAAFLLFLLLFGIAGIFVFAQAPFLAVSQIVVYVGGILILIIFGLMLTQKRIFNQPATRLHFVIPGVVIAGGLGSLLFYLGNQVNWEQLAWVKENAENSTNLDNTEVLGTHMLSTYLLPFELISVLLLVALIGAAYLAREDKG